jgi:hypothetical protein
VNTDGDAIHEGAREQAGTSRAVWLAIGAYAICSAASQAPSTIGRFSSLPDAMLFMANAIGGLAPVFLFLAAYLSSRWWALLLPLIDAVVVTVGAPNALACVGVSFGRDFRCQLTDLGYELRLFTVPSQWAVAIAGLVLGKYAPKLLQP